MVYSKITIVKSVFHNFKTITRFTTKILTSHEKFQTYFNSPPNFKIDLPKQVVQKNITDKITTHS